MSQSVNRRRAIEAVRNWNEQFPRGTPVTFEGRPAKTDSVAALGLKDVAAVFLEGVEEMVPLDRLDVPGWERTAAKRKGTVP